MNKKPYIIDFKKIGSPALGYISVAEKENLPFIPQRIYWTYFTPEDVERGGHAHIHLEQILVSVAGKIDLKIETITGEIFEFVLDAPHKGVFIPKKSWRTMKYSHNAVQMCIASIEYDEKDYIRDYDEFLNLTK
ncbi:MAG: FdtA/QdtA family cupin domain-containing protein [Flavobacteriales bacterium]|nr:FdtA/QdtA family cupin domain-containing protein [Flavobacteriales bacterium]MCW8937704.1 FdtA/QdtA family cupin domain-containing protein [Flavobacteriales bacterium]MCW8968579.1 FdtA/QdtA family cupin domain-containing protein [Flavobacteriales bacterium]MCW8990192.1 FdtA/QdtA family cupin domain-containing protein [Flavobacteriales bacterium]MCW9019910.1 FdtA/QdtA family cupin domain-containing protein [Flavobacteriales bacterium]